MCGCYREKLHVNHLTIPKFALAILTYCNMEFAQMKSKDCIRTAAQRFLGFSLEQFRDLSSENLYSARQCFALIYLASLALPLTHLHVCSLLLNVVWTYNAKLVSFQLGEGFFFPFPLIGFLFPFLANGLNYINNLVSHTLTTSWLTPKIWLSILPSSCYTFPCK